MAGVCPHQERERSTRPCGRRPRRNRSRASLPRSRSSTSRQEIAGRLLRDRHRRPEHARRCTPTSVSRSSAASRRLPTSSSTSSSTGRRTTKASGTSFSVPPPRTRRLRIANRCVTGTIPSKPNAPNLPQSTKQKRRRVAEGGRSGCGVHGQRHSARGWNRDVFCRGSWRARKRKRGKTYQGRCAANGSSPFYRGVQGRLLWTGDQAVLLDIAVCELPF